MEFNHCELCGGVFLTAENAEDYAELRQGIIIKVI